MRAILPSKHLVVFTLAAALVCATPLGTPANAKRDGADATRSTTVETVRTRGGIAFPIKTQVNGTELPLRGAQLLEWFRFDVYCVGLYAPPEALGIRALLDEKTPRRLELHYHRSIKASDIAKATEKIMARNPNADMEKLRTRLDALYKCYSDVKRGDSYAIDYHPDTGTVISLNGVEQCRIEGADFAAAFFGIWISEYSPNQSLARTLRGER